MPTLQIRNFPEELLQKIKERAARNHRSLSEEVIALIELALENEEIRSKRAAALARIPKNRKKAGPLPAGVDTLTLLREDRAR
jgi:plasmid stability protein